MLRQATQNLITALYPRLSHEDELQGDVYKRQLLQSGQHAGGLPLIGPDCIGTGIEGIGDCLLYTSRCV